MTNKSYIPILAVLGAIMLVVVAAMAPPQSFFGRDLVHAQVVTIDDATLSALNLGSAAPLSPEFAEDSDRRTYTARAVSGTDKVTVTATAANDGKAIVTISPPDQDSGTTGHQVLLRGGQNRVIMVRVVSEDRTVTETYTITVYQIRTQPSDNANLSALRLSGATLSPSFASDKDAYTGRAPYGTDEITVSYTADIGAMVSISAAPFPTDSSATADADGDTPGHQVALVAGGTNTVITVTVTAEDEMARDDPYIVTVYRENLVKSDDPSLATLTLSDGTTDGNTPITFTYDPSSADKSYDVRVPSGVRAVTVAATTTHPGCCEGHYTV